MDWFFSNIYNTEEFLGIDNISVCFQENQDFVKTVYLYLHMFISYMCNS